jgi:sortase A
MRAAQRETEEPHYGRHFAPPPWVPTGQWPPARASARPEDPTPPRQGATGLVRLLGWLGRGSIAVGVLVLLFLVYQLWGTGIATSRAQGRLEDDFAARLRAAEPTETTAPSPPVPGSPSSAAPVAPAAGVAPAEGEAGGRLEIPDIGVDWIFVEGIGVDDLRQGPGHFPATPFPGQAGNASLAGHRTTYGAPFNRIDELEPGDEIAVTTLQGRFTYTVSEQRIVRPDQVEVLRNFGDNRLTLIACHPKYSARQRIVVVAQLTGAPAPPTPADTRSSGSNSPVSLDDGAPSDTAATLPVVLWGLAPAGIWLAAWLVGQRWRRWPAYLAGLPLFLVALFVFFEQLGRLLPPSL